MWTPFYGRLWKFVRAKLKARLRNYLRRFLPEFSSSPAFRIGSMEKRCQHRSKEQVFQTRVVLSFAGAKVRELNTWWILRSNSSRVNGFETNTA